MNKQNTLDPRDFINFKESAIDWLAEKGVFPNDGFYVTETHVTFDQGVPGSEYFFEMASLKTEHELVNMIKHLRSKNFAERFNFKLLIELVVQINSAYFKGIEVEDIYEQSIKPW